MAPPLFFLCFLFFITKFPPSSSHSQPILLPLTHSLSAASFNATHHLLHVTSSRSSARFHRHFRNTHKPSCASSVSSPVSLPLFTGSDYMLSLTLPTVPPRTVSLFMDTGSDLVWFPCSPFSCILCEGKQRPDPVNLTSSAYAASRVPCGSVKCSAAHSYASSSDLCAIARCPLDSIEMSDCSSHHCPQFYYAYGDGSFLAT